jgi:AcrR family transcriptional regulator
MNAPVVTRKDQRREAILAVAAEVFFEEGYQAASMSTIAARLGGSKATLYNYFDSKEALFEAYIRESCGQIAAEILDFTDDQAPATVLARFGERFLDRILSERMVRTFQIIVAEARRTPELARMFFATGPSIGHDRLALYLRAAAGRGDLEIADNDEAAWQFFALCRTHHLQDMLGLRPKPSPDRIAAEVANAVDIFMARYGTARAAA